MLIKRNDVKSKGNQSKEIFEIDKWPGAVVFYAEMRGSSSRGDQWGWRRPSGAVMAEATASPRLKALDILTPGELLAAIVQQYLQLELSQEIFNC